MEPRNLFVYFVFAFVLIQRAAVRCIYEFDGKTISITKIGLLQTTTLFEVALKDVVGIYRYKAKLIGVLSFRRTFRLNSALDNRNVWTIAYTAPGPKGKIENRRIFFKPSEKMLDLIREKSSSRVKDSEEEVVIQQAKEERDNNLSK